ncbi:hypothetical protein ACFWXO_21830 [Kitasatospora sp. NPDC059088]|uniref:hypothetical protein n=1 Tax=Kitasatospora sp. NPDC059088 TaxID=3346722 RepID=UPI0036C91259
MSPPPAAPPPLKASGSATAPSALELSLRPAWDKDPINSWARRYLDHPLRLRIVCHKDGHKPWTLIREVPVPPGTRPAEHTSPAGSATA